MTFYSFSKKYSSQTEKPKGYKNISSISREEYEVEAPKKTVQHISNEMNQKFNYRTQKIPGGEKYNYFTSKQGSHSSKNYNQIC